MKSYYTSVNPTRSSLWKNWGFSLKRNIFLKNFDTNLVLLLAAFYALFNLVYIVKNVILIRFFSGVDIVSWQDFLLYNILVDWVVVVLYMSLIAVNTRRLLNKKYSWWSIISIHTILSLLIGAITHFIFDLFEILIGRTSLANHQPGESLRRFVSVIDLNFLIYFSMIFIIYIYYYIKQVKEGRQHRVLLENQLTRTRGKLLSSQLQPHFLFNTLNSISVLVDIDAKKARDTIADLSDFLRESLYSSGDVEIPLSKELNTLEYYLNILQVRFSDHLKIRKNIDQNLLPEKVPAMLLQPLIENSIKHGYSYNHTDLEVQISIQKERDYLVIKVDNSGEEISFNQQELMQKGIGLSNIDDRLRNSYGEDYLFEIRNKPDRTGVETIIKIPKGDFRK